MSAADNLRSAASAGTVEGKKQAWDQEPTHGDRKVKPDDGAEKPAGPDKAADKAGEPPKTVARSGSMKTAISARLGGSKAKWQWEHRTGFRDYSQVESDRIEAHFLSGVWMMRLKSGRGRTAKPREIYFYDMVQYDPESKSERNIRRVPGETRLERISRAFNSYWLGFTKGEENWWRQKSKKDFDHQREGRDDMDPYELLADVFRLDSFWFRLIMTWTFNGISMGAVLLNALWLFIDADYNTGTTFADTPWVFLIVDNIFCVYFLLELIIRFQAFRSCRSALRDSWFVLDLCLVILMIFETWILQLGIYIVIGSSRSQGTLEQFGVLRPLRLLRLSRITRLFKVFPQLFVLLKGVTQAMRSLVYTLLMLLVLMFMFGMVLKSFAEGEEAMIELKMDSVGGAMWVLLINGTFMDAVGDVLNVLKDTKPVYAGIMLAFIFLSNLTMLNMLIGILCEVVSRVTSEESDNAAKDELSAKVLDILECYDVEDDRNIRKPEFHQMMKNPDMQMILRDQDIDPNDVAKLEDVLFEELHPGGEDEGDNAGEKKYKELSFNDFLEKVIQLRGGNNATVTDIVELRGYLNRKLKRVEEKFVTNLRPPPSADPSAPPPVRPWAAASSASLDQTPKPSQSSDVPLPGQIKTDVSDAAFKEAVLSQLSLLRVGQEMLRGEVTDLHNKVQGLQQALTALPSGTSDGAGAA